MIDKPCKKFSTNQTNRKHAKYKKATDPKSMIRKKNSRKNLKI